MCGISSSYLISPHIMVIQKMKEKDLGICVLWIMPVKFQGIWSALCRTCYGLFGGRFILIIWLAISHFMQIHSPPPKSVFSWIANAK
jgi:hypothetical protein